MSELTESPAWREVAAHHRATAGTTLTELFAADPARVERFTFQDAGLTLDLSKTHITPGAHAALIGLARQEDVLGWRDRMFAGEAVNFTENRPALHPALRTPELAAVTAGDEVVADTVEDMQRRLRAWVEAVESGAALPGGDGHVTDVVHIGIGGSELGPRLACEALSPAASAGHPRVHFIANVDPDEREAVLERIDPARTLVIVASKGFGTRETLANAAAVYDHLTQALGAERACGHFVAITAQPARARAWGIADERILPLPIWVGGRYSLWSSVGLPVALACGMDRFEALCAGAAAMDRHFRAAPAEQNLPLQLALVGIWYVNFEGMTSHAVVPYAHRLRRLPAYLQQLEMESNGKSVDRSGRAVDYATAPAIWGGEGTNAQHAFFQWLHQGTQRVLTDIIAVRAPGGDRDVLAANALGQSAALLEGRTREDLRRAGVVEALRPHRAMAGDRPTNTVVLDGLSPETLGALLALYEHKVFCEAMIWRINPFDQWGVELGKERSGDMVPVLRGEAIAAGWDGSTRQLARAWQGAPQDPSRHD